MMIEMKYLFILCLVVFALHSVIDIACGTSVPREEITASACKSESAASFVAKYKQYAIRAGGEIGTNPVFVISQWALETGYGSSKDCKLYNNFAGIGHYDDASKGFSYSSMDHFIDDYARVLKLKRYVGIKSCKTAYEFGNTLYKGGYASDPGYPEKIAKIAATIQKIY
jgi:peptidoglycan hydrolase FlgJ